jgi:hypothetical protein
MPLALIGRGEPDFYISADQARILTMPPRDFWGVQFGECLGSLGEWPAKPTSCPPALAAIPRHPRGGAQAARARSPPPPRGSLDHPERLLRRAGHRAYGAGRCSQASAPSDPLNYERLVFMDAHV